MFYKNGQLLNTENYKDGFENGLFKAYYKNGQLKSIGNYEGVKLSVAEAFHQSVGLLDTFHQLNVGGERSKKTGIWKSYYENGQLKSEEKWGENEQLLSQNCWDVDGNEIDCTIIEQ